jgi:hypothetical protein
VWNIAEWDLYKSGSYPRVTARNIPRFACYNSCLINGLMCFRTRTENLRVGGSISPLATKINGLQRDGALSEIKVSVLLASLRGDARFAAMLRKMQLPE